MKKQQEAHKTKDPRAHANGDRSACVANGIRAVTARRRGTTFRRRGHDSDRQAAILGRMHPREEVVDERTEVLIAKRLALGLGRAPEHAIRGVDRADRQQPLQPDRVAIDRHLEEVAPAVCPAADEPDAFLAVLRRAVLENVVYVARIRGESCPGSSSTGLASRDVSCLGVRVSPDMLYFGHNRTRYVARGYGNGRCQRIEGSQRQRLSSCSLVVVTSTNGPAGVRSDCGAPP